MLFRDFKRDLTVIARPDAPATPRVSVILPTYARGNGPLQRAIESVLSQDWGDLELLVIDDGSKDATRDVLNAIQKADARLVIHRYESNSGLPGLRVNQAALMAKGDIIAYQFDDDIWLGTDSLSRRVRVLDGAAAPAVAYGNALTYIERPDGRVSEHRLGGPFNFGKLRGGNYIANNTVAHHVRMFELAGMYDPHVALRRYCDYDLWLRFAAVGDFLWIDADLAQVHANLDNSLGKEVPLDLDRYLRLVSTNRNALLKPDLIGDYDVLRMAASQGDTEDVRAYFQDEAVPFLAQFNDYCDPDALQTVGAAEVRSVSLYVIKPDHSTSVDVTVGNFASVDLWGVLSYRFAREVSLPLLKPRRRDTLLMYRTVTASTSGWLNKRPLPCPTAYMMDDNMLCFHEVGPEHAALAPGTPAHKNIEYQIRAADACIGYGEVIAEDLRVLNPRTLQLSTNIPGRYVARTRFDRGAKVRIAVLTGPVRNGILAELWSVLQAFASRHREQLEFHFWGVDPQALGGLECEVHHRPFTHHYGQYLDRLVEHAFDVMLVPLDDRTRPAQSKSPVKLLEGVAAGAVCIFSDALPYRGIPDDCCLKVPNTAQAWSEALEQVVTLGAGGRAAMFARAQAFVVSHYTTQAQFYDFMAAMRSIELHRRLGGRAILYGFHETALGGATLHLIHHAGLMAALGIRVVAVAPRAPQWEAAFAARWFAATGAGAPCFARWSPGYDDRGSAQRMPDRVMHEDAQALAIELAELGIGMLHFATWSPVMSLLAGYLAVPVVASVHQHYPGSEAGMPGFADAIHCSSRLYGKQWGRNARSRVMAQVCPVEGAYFDQGRCRPYLAKTRQGPWRILVSGTLQERKNQLEAVGALVQLRQEGWNVQLDLIGYEEFAPEYLAQCRALAADAGMAEFVHFHGFIDDPLPFYAQSDVLLISATDESMPQTLLQAMAAGVAVVSPRVGGVPEMVRHHYTGILARSSQRADLADALKQWFDLSPQGRQEMRARAGRAIALVGRMPYVKLKLTDLYLDAHEVFDRRFSAVPRDQEVFGQETLGGLRRAVMEEARDEVAPLVPVPVPTVEVALLPAVQLDEWFECLAPQELPSRLQRLSEMAPDASPRWQSRLGLSGNLRNVPYVEYALPAHKRPLSRVTLAIYWPFGVSSGMVGVEIVTPQQGVVAHEVVWAHLIDNANSLTVTFREPLPPMRGKWALRVFARDVEAPVAVVERSHLSWLPWRRVRRPVFLAE